MRQVERKKNPLNPQNERSRLYDLSSQHEFYAGTAKKAYDNALTASGINAVIYNRMQTGKKCTCFIEAPTKLDKEGQLNEEGMEEILQSTRKPHGVYGTTKRTTFTADDLDIDLKEVDSLNDYYEDDEYESIDTTDFDRIDVNTGYGQNRCGVCLGTGYVGGYSSRPGYRLVLDVQSEHERHSTKEIKTSVQPYAFVGTGYVKFRHPLPVLKGVKSNVLKLFRVWNNDIPLKHSSYTWNKAEIKNTIKLGTEKEWLVNVETEEDFTHVEIQLGGELVPIDMPQIPDSFEASMLGDRVQTTLNLPSTVDVSRNSIVRETKFNRAWQISQLSPYMDTSGIIVSWEAEARLVEHHELLNMLAGAV